MGPYGEILAWHRHNQEYGHEFTSLDLHHLVEQTVTLDFQTGQIRINSYPTWESWKGVTGQYLGQHDNFTLAGIPQAIIDNAIEGRPVPEILSANAIDYDSLPSIKATYDYFLKKFNPPAQKDKSDKSMPATHECKEEKRINERPANNNSRRLRQRTVQNRKRVSRPNNGRKTNSKRVRNKVSRNSHKKKKATKNRTLRKQSRYFISAIAFI